MAHAYKLKRTSAPPKSGIDFAKELNPEQYAAATAGGGASLVIAGAGSGKTRTLIYRLAFLMEQGVQPWQILLLTFTNKAAREMLHRAEALLGQDLRGLWGGTFHSIGARMLRKNAALLGYEPEFSILDREDAEKLMKTVYQLEKIDTKDKGFPKAGVLCDIVSFATNTDDEVREVVFHRNPQFIDYVDTIEGLARSYRARKVAANAMDFDDLLLQAIRLLKQEPEVAEEYSRRFHHVLVDEYQDTNVLQSRFIDALSAGHGNLMVVGDDAQSIYSWRGADFRNILDFPKRYPGASVHKIETNYRSVPEVLAVANSVINQNTEQFHKELRAARTTMEKKPAVIELEDSQQQAQFVTQRIRELLEDGMEPSDIAVLYRAHFHSMELQMALTRGELPYQITSGLRFFEQAHVKDVTSYMRFVMNPRDEVAFKRMVLMMPGLGEKTADKMWLNLMNRFQPGTLPLGAGNFPTLLSGLTVPGKAGPAWQQLIYTLDELAPAGIPVEPSAMIHSVIEAVYDDYLKSKFPNYESRREDLNTLEGFAAQFADAGEFLSQLALLTSMDTDTTASTANDDMVTLSSIHQAKGLEWKAVFVIFLADGLFPGKRSLDDPASLEEERRLFYVACTRAMNQLYLVWPRVRLNAGYGEMFLTGSRFLREIGTELVEEWEVD